MVSVPTAFGMTYTAIGLNKYSSGFKLPEYRSLDGPVGRSDSVVRRIDARKCVLPGLYRRFGLQCTVDDTIGLDVSVFLTVHRRQVMGQSNRFPASPQIRVPLDRNTVEWWSGHRSG